MTSYREYSSNSIDLIYCPWSLFAYLFFNKRQHDADNADRQFVDGEFFHVFLRRKSEIFHEKFVVKSVLLITTQIKNYMVVLLVSIDVMVNN